MESQSESALSIVKAYKERYLAMTPPDNHDRELLEQLNILNASVTSNGQVGTVTYSIRIPTKYSNHFGTVHGGAISTLFDGITSAPLALLSRDGYWDGNEVSRSIHIRFFR